VSKRYTTKQSTPWCQDICVLYTWNGLAGEWQSEKPEIYKNIPKTDVNLEDFPDFFEALEEIKEPSDEKARINKLAEWCKTRNGQTIVCENTKADWLPFKPMKEMYGSQYKTTEAIWSNHVTNYDNVQLPLFNP